LKVYHQWNSVARINDGTLPAGEVDITGDVANVTIINGPPTDINVTIAAVPGAGLRGGILQTLEGGTIRIEVVASTALASGEVLINETIGHFENDSGAFDIFDNDDVLVANPDLWIRKQPHVTDPVAGQNVNYTLTISNEGPHSAPNVVVSDVLPIGMCYNAGSSSVSLGWSIGEPSITGGPCQSAPTTLTWNNLSPNTIPGYDILTGDITTLQIFYSATVHASVVPGTSLLNGACVETDIPEDPIYPNCTGVSVNTPYPDPALTKGVVPLSILPGEDADFTISYQNNTRQSASNAYIIDTLPDSLPIGAPDGYADMEIRSIIPGRPGEVVYYNDALIGGAPPAFDIADPAA